MPHAWLHSGYATGKSNGAPKQTKITCSKDWTQKQGSLESKSPAPGIEISKIVPSRRGRVGTDRLARLWATMLETAGLTAEIFAAAA